MNPTEIIDWLLEGDVAIQYQTHRDLLGTDRPDLQARIATEGWGNEYFDHRNSDGSWGIDFYHPKWTCTHWTLLELKALAIAPDSHSIREQVSGLQPRLGAKDGGIGTYPGCKKSDVCVNGMYLNYATYFGVPEEQLHTVVDFLLSEHMQDGGFNCVSNRSGAHHSSLHSTLSVLEGIQEYSKEGYTYRLDELLKAAATSRKFILIHNFYKSDRTGEVINKDFLKLPYPPRWRYNILKALDYFRAAGQPYDKRMADALEVLKSIRCKDGTWPRQAKLPGKVFFVMEPPRGPSRWNTLLALRVLKTYQQTE